MRVSRFEHFILLLISPFIAVAYAVYSLFRRARRLKECCPLDNRFYRLTLPLEQARCSDGSPYSIYIKRGTVNKLLVYFSGGGLSWNEYTAARPMAPQEVLSSRDTFYFPDCRPYLELANIGILSAGNARNPFHDWNCISIPYATGDCHTGNNEYPYNDKRGRARVLYHYGARNVEAALTAAQAHFGPPEQLLIAGESAGGIGCVAQAPNVLRHFPCQRVAVFSDSGLLYSPDWRAILRDVWKAEPSLVDCVDTGNLMVDLFTWLYGQLGDQAVYLQYCSVYDGVLSRYENMLNHGEFTRDIRALTEFYQHLNETIKTLAGRIPSFRFFLSEQEKSLRDGSTAHTASRYPRYYFKTPQGMSLSAWLDDAVNGDKLYHVGENLLSGPGRY